MRVGFDAKRAFLNNTGLGNYSRFVIRALSQQYPEHEYYLYTPSAGENQDTRLLLQHTRNQLRTPSKMVSKMGMSSIWRSAILGNIAIKDQVRLFHGLSNELPIITSKNLRTVVTIHDLLFLRYPELYNAMDAAIYKHKFRHACKVSDRIIAVSQQTSRDIQQFFGIPESKIDVVYQGCHESFKKEYSPLQLEETIQQYRLPEEFMLNVGTIEPRKNAMVILQAMVAAGDKLVLPLVIVGKSGPYKEQLIKYAKENNLLNRVYFLHNIPSEELPKIYQLAKIFIYPAIFEGFGIPIIEALNAKVPVISTKGGCFEEAGGPESKYVAHNDPQAMAETIVSINNNANIAGKMILKGQEHVKKFESSVIAAALMRTYMHTLSA